MEEKRISKVFLIITLIIITFLFGFVGYMLIDRVTKLVSNPANEDTSGEKQSGEDEGKDETYVITWINDDGTVLEVDSNVKRGVVPTFDQPTNPTKEGEGLISYTFKGWNKEVVAANGDATYVATYTTNYSDATVTFDLCGVGTPMDAIQVEYGKYVNKPGDPIAEGHVFVAWYKDSSYSTPWNFSTDIVTSNVTIYAKWEVLSYQVSFYLDEYEEELYVSQSVAYGEKVTRPADPIPDVDNKIFEYWYTYDVEENTVIWNFDEDVVRGPTKIYAWWTYYL